jgi:hypothetical protein
MLITQIDVGGERPNTMVALKTISFFVGLILYVIGGLFFVKAERMYMKRIGRESGWAYPWDILHYRGKEKKFFFLSAVVTT